MNFIKKHIHRNLKRALAIALVILSGLSCKKQDNVTNETKISEVPPRCGILLTRPVLDSFVYPTCHITAFIAFPEGKRLVHFKYNVSGANDGSWFLERYDKDSSFCITP